MPDKIFANAVVKCRDSALLGAEKTGRLLDAPTLADAIKTLSEFGYAGGHISADDLDAMTFFEQGKVFETFFELCSDRFLKNIFTAKIVFHNAKALYKSRFAEISKESVFYPYGGQAELEEKMSSKNYDGLIKELAACLESLDERFPDETSPPGPLEIDLALDKAMYAYIRKNAFFILNLSVRKYYFAEIDLLNILTAFRIRQNGMPEAEFLRLSVSGKGVKDFSYLVSGDLSKLTDVFRSSPYLDVIKLAADDVQSGKGLVAAEREADNFLLRLAKKDEDGLFTIKPFFSFIITRLAEIKNVKIILTGKYNKVDGEKIKQRLRDA